MEHPKRSIVKAVTWRLTGYIITVAAVYLYSKNMRESVVAVASADAVKMFLYYYHERVWNKVKFGRLKKEDYQI
ncbi:MAG TPA: hypothetical protein DCL35_07455 [Candidatus Omnitrophica bacterium]|nr:hypothetical protein [Candidatus Omnitrophota bacterium]